MSALPRAAQTHPFGGATNRLGKTQCFSSELSFITLVSASSAAGVGEEDDGGPWSNQESHDATKVVSGERAKTKTGFGSRVA